jgi:hypothetical protein
MGSYPYGPSMTVQNSSGAGLPTARPSETTVGLLDALMVEVNNLHAEIDTLNAVLIDALVPDEPSGGVAIGGGNTIATVRSPLNDRIVGIGAALNSATSKLSRLRSRLAL